MFIKIKGQTYPHGGHTYYEVLIIDSEGDYEPCASYSSGVLTDKYTGGEEEFALECHSWGYDGLGPQLLACNILAFYAKGGSQDIARKYYREFTTEVIANLPVDEPWELTMEQIDRWLRNKTKTKGKTNERKSTKTKGG